MILTEITRPLLQPHLEKGFHDLPFETYLKMFGASSHGLMDMRRSPKYYKWRRENPIDTDALSLGRLVHLMVLEPEKFALAKIKKKVDGRTKVGKAYNEEFEASLLPGDIVVEESQKRKLELIHASMLANEFVKEVLTRPSLKEQTAFWIHEDTKVFCKFRPDITILEGDIMVDVKTCANAHQSVFTKQIYNLCYDMQAAFYLDGYYRKTGRHGKFFWLCPETEGVHDVACYHATDKIHGFGRVRYEKELRKFAHCFAKDDWPGYPKGIIPADLPGWVETAEQNLEDTEAFLEEAGIV